MKTKKKKAAAKRKTNPTPRVKKDLRTFPRVTVSNFYVTERNGDYQYVLKAANISEGGLFLVGRSMVSTPSCELIIPISLGSRLIVEAEQVHDRTEEGRIGVGYRFTKVSKQQAKELRSLLRNLD